MRQSHHILSVLVSSPPPTQGQRTSSRTNTGGYQTPHGALNVYKTSRPRYEAQHVKVKQQPPSPPSPPFSMLCPCLHLTKT